LGLAGKIRMSAQVSAQDTLQDVPLARKAVPGRSARAGLCAMLRASAIAARDVYRFLAFPFSHFRGVYETFSQAAASSRTARIGYDHPDLARQYRAELYLALDNSEYPVLYHLARMLTDNCTVLDFGGNIGIHYLRYRKHLDLAKVRWIVCDLPAITGIGRATCAGMSNVEFVNDLDDLDVDRIDIFLASDCLQYVEAQDALLPRLIGRGIRPRHVLIDQLPLYDGPRFVTLQNGGLVRYPQYVFNRAEYVSGVAELGYELVDSWDCRNFSCIVPFHPDKAVRVYSGLCFSEQRTMEK
jgi:putative methyltransferase (TIGR04325 family)